MLSLNSGTPILVSILLGLCFMAQGCGGNKEAAENNGAISSTQSHSAPAINSSAVATSSEAEALSSVMTQSSMANSSSSLAGDALACGDLSPGITNGRLNSAGKAHMLCLHNQTRSKVALGTFTGLNTELDFATDMRRLQWDDKLAQVSRDWSSRCEWMHNGNRTDEYNTLNPTDIHGGAISGRESVGENLSYFSASNATGADFSFTTRGYELWEEEGNHYSYGDLNVNDYCAKEPCGHFTQLIWAQTYKVGCEVNFCAADTLSPYPATFLVCNYASAGNYIGRTPYQSSMLKSEVCSAANSGEGICRQGLTESPSYQSGL